MQQPAILVIHGITMSGASMLRLLGPVGDGLRAAGFDLIAPDAGVKMSPEQVEGVVSWARSAYAARGQDADEAFCDGVFWGGEHHDWFASTTDPETQEKIYAGLEPGLRAISEATAGHRVVGVLGFSQGCAMAGVVTGVARRGRLPFGDTLRFGVYLCGFKPSFDRPALRPWPVPDVAGLFVAGTEDAVFPDPAGIRQLAAEFHDPELHVVEGLTHTVPTSPDWVRRIVDFATRHRP